jgi:hypothetical protein
MLSNGPARSTTRIRLSTDNDIAYARHTLDSILTQLNRVLRSAVLAFDFAARSTRRSVGGDRYAVGRGLRFILASSVRITRHRHRRKSRGPSVFVDHAQLARLAPVRLIGVRNLRCE